MIVEKIDFFSFLCVLANFKEAAEEEDRGAIKLGGISAASVLKFACLFSPIGGRGNHLCCFHSLYRVWGV